MINKVKNYLIIAGILIVLSLAVTNYLNHKKYLKEKADRIRLENNQAQLLAEKLAQITLNLKQKEFISSLSSENDSLLKALKIKPKTVVKYVERTSIIHDTVTKEVPVYITGYRQWHVKDSGQCWKWEADAYLINDSLNIDRTLFNYKNTTTDIFTKKLKFKFLFIKIYSGKEIVQKSSSECGSETTKTVNVIKR